MSFRVAACRRMAAGLERDTALPGGHGEAEETAIGKACADDGDRIVDYQQGERDQFTGEEPHGRERVASVGSEPRDVWSTCSSTQQVEVAKRESNGCVSQGAIDRKQRAESPEAAAHLFAAGGDDAHRRPNRWRDKECEP